ncbi:MAG: 7-cyano-7-deazaguanine synthase, partial [Pseudomonadales bacterium]|nr:7-cyano-7-deazaguanine synthase [Pseudomonadales bacterium]
GLSLGVNYANTRSCYRLNSCGEACGQCDSCTLRAEGFREAGIIDPTVYIEN